MAKKMQASVPSRLLPRIVRCCLNNSDVKHKINMTKKYSLATCDTELTPPDGVFYAEYTSGGDRMFAFCSEAKENVTFDVLCRSVTLSPQEVCCEVFNK